MHLTRGISGTISLTLWFFSIAGLPIATAMTINYSSPLFIGAWVAWSAHRAGRAIDATMLVALGFGFAGVLLLLQPTIASDQWIFAVIGTVSAALSAIAYLSVKALGQAGERNMLIVFYFSSMNAAAGLAGSLAFGFHRHDLRGVALLACVGIAATLAQLAMTRAYASGGTLLTANLGFTGIIFASIWGVVLFDDAIHAASAIGMTIIVASGVSATLLTARTLRRTEAPRDETIGPR
jgi:S-adenosylmethionine uptake transporter